MATTTTISAINSTTSSSTSLHNDSETEVHDASDAWEDAVTPRITFLSVFIGFGFIGNIFLIVTICHSRRFRSVAFYIFLSNLAIVNISECAFNMTVLLSVTISKAWTFGNIPCQVSAFFLHLICVETVLALTILTTDRLIAVRFKEKYDHVFSTPRISILISYTWFQSLAFSMPVAVGAVPTSANVYIKHCSIANGGSIAYGIISTIACVIVPLILKIVFFVKIVRTGYKDRMLIRGLISQHNYKDESQPEPRIKTEIRYTNLTATVCAAWLIMNGPYVVTLYFNMLQHSSELDDVTGDQVKYVWYVDLVLLWLRFSFTLVLPIASFTWNKELWKSFKDMILCRKNNAINDESFKKSESDTQKLERKIKEEQKREKEKEKEVILNTAREQRVFHVPVLFATSHGVHIQTEVDDSDSEPSESKHGGTLRGKKCDVIGSQDNLNNLGDDTSDYDTGTEMDPFSTSHPVSVRQLKYPDALSKEHRSSSHPEVRDRSIKTNLKDSGTVGGSSAGDSGLDLSTGISNNTFNSPARTPGKTESIVNKEAVVQNDADDSRTYPESDPDFMQKKISDVDNASAMCDVVPFSDETKQGEISHSVKDTVKTCVVPGTDNRGETSCTKVEQFKHVESISIESPITKRRKKKRKDKNIETNSQGTGSPILPLRPPPRLAPISNIKTLYSGPGRPGSSCSSQYSGLDSADNMQSHGTGLHSESCSDFAKSDITSLDNLSLSSFTTRRSTMGIINNNNSLESNDDSGQCNLDCKRKIKSVPEEVLSPSECHVTGFCEASQYHRHNDGPRGHETILEKCGEVNVPEIVQSLPPSGGRNSDARKKRRERIASNSILSEGKGYTRLKTES